MKKTIIIIFLAHFMTMAAVPLKILHMSLHKGCINDFREVANQLSLDVTDWYIHDSHIKFDPLAKAAEVYNISAERASRVWELNKDYFDQFDVIVTSDTAPLSRIFLQNNWQKQLIIWVCNRFDYYDGASSDGKFPDAAYYDLFRQATHKSNVHIVSYTPYEHYYARQKGIDIGTLTIRPIGVLPPASLENLVSAIPSWIDKSQTLFLYPRMSVHQAEHVQQQCKNLDIATFHGKYNGPDDLTGFKGVLYFPYAWSNLALFENIQRGIVHFVPSVQFIQTHVPHEPIPHHTRANFELCDWYCNEYKDLFVYFDSWQDLQEKVKSTDYASLHAKIKKAGFIHWQKNLDAWRQLFDEIING